VATSPWGGIPGGVWWSKCRVLRHWLRGRGERGCPPPFPFPGARPRSDARLSGGEAYLPSQHVTGDEGWLASLQQRCDQLAAAEHARVKPYAIPFREVMSPHVLVLVEGALALSTRVAMRLVYDRAVERICPGITTDDMSPVGFPQRLHTPDTAARSALRWSLLHYAAPVVQASAAPCPLCGAVTESCPVGITRTESNGWVSVPVCHFQRARWGRTGWDVCCGEEGSVVVVRCGSKRGVAW
jgi:hypothetical protein